MAWKRRDEKAHRAKPSALATLELELAIKVLPDEFAKEFRL
jgi:hypothetical protein